MIDLSPLERNLDPFPLYREMRQEHPVYFDPQRQNWNIFRFSDVKQALSEYQIFSSQFISDGALEGGRPSAASMPFAASMISSDPPRHRKLRALVSQAFTPAAVEALEPRIKEIVAEYLDPIPSGQPVDLIEALAYPLPVIVIAEMLGIPASDRERFKGWSDTIVQFADLRGDLDPERFMSPAILEMSQYFFALIEERQARPGDDLVSGLLAAEVDGERLEMIELLGFCALLLVAGNETTTNLIGNALLTFAEQPHLWEELRSKPDRLPAAIEEVLRYRSPVQSMFRVAKADIPMAGQTIPAGSPVVAWIGSANHDESQFPDPESFQIERSPNRHLGFGHGIHYCLGAPLARTEAQIALEAMLERFEGIRLAPDAELERLPSFLVYGLKSLPLILD